LKTKEAQPAHYHATIPKEPTHVPSVLFCTGLSLPKHPTTVYFLSTGCSFCRVGIFSDSAVKHKGHKELHDHMAAGTSKWAGRSILHTHSRCRRSDRSDQIVHWYLSNHPLLARDGTGLHRFPNLIELSRFLGRRCQVSLRAPHGTPPCDPGCPNAQLHACFWFCSRMS